MSFDLMVFALEDAPKDRTEFLEWYEIQTDWSKNETSFDPSFTNPNLQKWITELSQQFPAMNGPLAPEDDDAEDLTDYTITKSVIYASFPWSQSESAYKAAKDLAIKHQVGFFNASSANGEIEYGVKTESTTSISSNSPWWKFW